MSRIIIDISIPSLNTQSCIIGLFCTIFRIESAICSLFWPRSIVFKIIEDFILWTLLSRNKRLLIQDWVFRLSFHPYKYALQYNTTSVYYREYKGQKNFRSKFSCSQFFQKSERKTSALVARAKFCKYFVHFLEELKTRNKSSEI